MGMLNGFQGEAYKTYIFARKLFLNVLDAPNRHEAARKMDALLIEVANGDAVLDAAATHLFARAS